MLSAWAGRWYTCPQCGNDFWGLRRKLRKYCSRECMYAGRSAYLNGARCYQWKGGKQIAKGYVLLWVEYHPRAKRGHFVPEHILVAERALGHYLPEKAEVHHINLNPADNRQSNLVICQDDRYHKLLHVRRRVFINGGHPSTDGYCSACKSVLPKSLFPALRYRASGIRTICCNCEAARRKVVCLSCHQYRLRAVADGKLLPVCGDCFTRILPMAAHLPSVGVEIAVHFLSRVISTETDCWQVSYRPRPSSFGLYQPIGGSKRSAAEWAWEMAGRKRTPETQISQTCGTPGCIFPPHLIEESLAAFRIRRGTSKKLWTHCSRGHPFTPENTHMSPVDGTRRCLKCYRASPSHTKS